MAETGRYTQTRGQAGDARDKVASPAEVTAMVMAEAQRRGLNWFRPHHAAGMVGSFMQETGNFRRDVLDLQLRGDDGTAYGLMQWRGKRYQNLQSYAQERNANVRDIRTQVSFAFEEGAPGSKYADFGSVKALRQFRSARNIRETATAFVHAERPAGYDGNPNNAHDVSRRINHASNAINQYGDGEGINVNAGRDNPHRLDPRGEAARTNPRVRDRPPRPTDFMNPSQNFGMGNYSNTSQNNGSYDDLGQGDYNSNGMNGTGLPNPERILTPDSFGLNDFIFDQSNNPFLNSQRSRSQDIGQR